MLWLLRSFLVVGVFIVSKCVGFVEYDLSSSSGSTWNVRNSDGSINVPASIPGLIHTDLLSAGILKENPYFRFNEVEQSWVCKEQYWVYSTSFQIPELSSGGPLSIELAGVDTVGTIKINDYVIGRTENAFQTYIFEVPIELITDTNTLSIEIASPITEAHNRAAAYTYSVPETENYNVWAEPSDRNFLRKAGCDFGWDWGPAYAPSGITGHVTLFHSTMGKLEGMTVLQSLATNYSKVTMNPRIRLANVKATTEVNVLVTLDGVEVLNGVFTATPGSYTVLALGSFDIHQPTLWFPVGFGEAFLYSVDVKVCPSFISSGATGTQYKQQTVSCQTFSRRVGVREVLLIREYIDDDTFPLKASNATHSRTAPSRYPARSLAMPQSPSTPLTLYEVPPQTYYFKVNGMPVFARGANFIPIDSFSSRVTPSDR